MKTLSFSILVAGALAFSHSVIATPLNIFTAVELEFSTESGKTYQLEASSNLKDWVLFGSRIDGTGTDFHLMVSTRETGMRFFRLLDLDLSPGLVAFYRLDANAADSTTNRNHGQSFGVVATTNRFGISNAALSFSGSWTSYVSVADSPSLDITAAITLLAWINFEVGGSSSPRIVHKHVYELFTYDYDKAVRRPGFQLFDVGSISTAPSLYAGQWMFLAATFDGSTMKLYVNGLLASSVAGPLASIPTNNRALNIGRNGITLDDSYQGIIDDVRIYNRALSDAEIVALFNASQ